MGQEIKKRKAIVYIAQSLDGFIAGPNDNLSFLSIVENGDEDYGYYKFLQQIDTIIIGRKTYDWVMTQVNVFPHADLETYVITHEDKIPSNKTSFYTSSIDLLLQELKAKKGQDIFIDGGAQIVNQLLELNHIDELILSIVPIILGEGTKLFHNSKNTKRLNLIGCQSFEKGLVQLHYSVEKQQLE